MSQPASMHPDKYRALCGTGGLGAVGDRYERQRLAILRHGTGDMPEVRADAERVCVKGWHSLEWTETVDAFGKPAALLTGIRRKVYGDD